MGDFQHDIVASAIDYLASAQGAGADLDALALRFGYEPTHFQKLFTARAGISPKRMAQYLAYTRARDFLLQGYKTLDAAYAAGLSGNGRLHDLFVTCEAATPGQVRQRGAGLRIVYGYHPSPIGDVLIARTEAGVCWTGFIIEDGRDGANGRMVRHWPLASFIEDADATREAAEHIMGVWQERSEARRPRLALDLHGTNFQIQVWRALLKIPSGAAVSYGDIAASLGVPKASRAVGTAVGANPVAWLIPCHRVIQKSGIVENYAWGTARKRILLALEAADILQEAKVRERV